MCGAANSCSGHRRGQLCGECMDGYTESILSAQCVPMSTCDDDQRRVWPVVAISIVAVGVVQLVLVSDVWMLRSSDTQHLRRLQLQRSRSRYGAESRGRAHSGGSSLGPGSVLSSAMSSDSGKEARCECGERDWASPAPVKVKLTIYFFQMQFFVRVAEVSRDTFTAVVSALLSVQLPSTSQSEVPDTNNPTSEAGTPSGSSGFCIVRGLSAKGKVELEAAMQFAVGIAMVVVYVSVAVAAVWRRHVLRRQRRASERQDQQRQGTHSAVLARGHGGDHLPARAQQARSSGYVALPATSPVSSSRLVTEMDGGSGDDDDDEEVVRQGVSHERRIGAVVNFGLTVYSTITIACMKLLHCVTIPGVAEKTFLFVQVGFWSGARRGLWLGCAMRGLAV